MFKVNEGSVDRTIRIILGFTALVAGLFILTGTLKIVAIVLGIIAIITGVLGFCGIYSLLGINTLKK